ncbi:hypothetical protein B6I21_02205 [candidate division KSB1 bacterium 4572_119]|nr:MAG: hypothetical protein B6I21_02205 [candidate division KSB1 bacterium 4572_119]
MCEMLGNQYFLARKYSLAAIELEKALGKDPANKSIRRKLVICRIQSGKIQQALELFSSLIDEDVAFIMDADPILDDCPCPELVYDFEKQLNDNKKSLECNLKLAMIWLYCDIEKSILYFNKSLELLPDDPEIKRVLKLLTNYLSSQENKDN